MTVPIKVALLWHQHQPYYKNGSLYHLPWVRLHATKDYYPMAKHLLDNPKMRATINLVPALLEQIDDYANGASDRLLILSRKFTEDLTSEEVEFIRASCLQANRKTMILRSKRYEELSEILRPLEIQELRDLVVHHLLAWTGEELRDTEFIAALVKQEENFTEDQKNNLLDIHQDIIRSVISIHQEVADQGNVELTATPYFHPILPLLCDTNSALEAMQNIALPSRRFSSLDDAKRQVATAMTAHSHHFAEMPKGMWPAEGSISNAALSVMAEHGLDWTASDETVLLHSAMHPNNSAIEWKYGDLEKYFPRLYGSTHNEIVVFFRDHELSDKIGFDYRDWNAEKAVSDFVSRIKTIRNRILDEFGEPALRSACISIILDGENCWEYYEKNGEKFVTLLYEWLSEDSEIETVTFSDAMLSIGKENIRNLDHIVAGSWIGGNFDIWIGEHEENIAWDYLGIASDALSKYGKSDRFSLENFSRAQDSLLKAEGSDWFWWFGDDHYSENRAMFDELFRLHLRTVYNQIGIDVPEYLKSPIISAKNSTSDFSSMHRG